MQFMGLWRINNNNPERLEEGGIDLEKHLEEWIEADPGLIQSDLTIIGRQIKLKSRPIDLLALDPVGNWVIIEVKKAKLYRDVVTQAIDYASDIDSTPFRELNEKVDKYLVPKGSTLRNLLEERGIDDFGNRSDKALIIYLVGIERDSNLERMVNFLSNKYGMSINIITFRVFKDKSGQRILIRELAEIEARSSVDSVSSMSPQEIPIDVVHKLQKLNSSQRVSPSLEDLCASADKNGIGQEFRIILDAALRHNLYCRTFKNSIMYTPPTNRSRMLFTVRTKPKGGRIAIFLSPDAFAEFYPVSKNTAGSILGYMESDWYYFTVSQADQFGVDLDKLFAVIENPDQFVE